MAKLIAQHALECALRGIADQRKDLLVQAGAPLGLDQLDRIFRFVECAFAAGGWDAVEAPLLAVPEFAEPMGPLGPLWCAIQIERGVESRVPGLVAEVARDVHHSLTTTGRMRYAEG